MVFNESIVLDICETVNDSGSIEEPVVVEIITAERRGQEVLAEENKGDQAAPNSGEDSLITVDKSDEELAGSEVEHTMGKLWQKLGMVKCNEDTQFGNRITVIHDNLDEINERLIGPNGRLL
jgi:hypothetical protein